MFDQLFGGMSHANYDQRVVGRYVNELTRVIVSTVMVTDSSHPYETGIKHPLYNDGDFIIVEQYHDPEAAKIGHDKWVKVMTAEMLPEFLNDVSTCEIAAFAKFVAPDIQTVFKKSRI